MREVVIVSAVRTPVGKFQGALSEKTAVELGAIVVREAVTRAAHVAHPVLDDLVCAFRDPARCVAVCWAAVRRVVFETAVARRVVARGDDDAVCLFGVPGP